MLPSSRPLRTARARFRACRSSLSNASYHRGDAASLQRDLGYVLVGDRWDGEVHGFRLDLIPLVIATEDGGYANP